MAAKILQNTFKKLLKEPVEGFCCELVNDSNLFEWKIFLEGPRDTPYSGGVFQLIMTFPQDYPMSPPTLKFVSEFWHPNVYPNGNVCISILHPPGEDPMSGELPEERWLPTQTVSTVLLSVISMLNDPNTSSPANVDASVQWRNDKDGFRKKCSQLIQKANAQLPPGIKIPHPDTDPEERQRVLDAQREVDNFDFYEDPEDYNSDDNADESQNEDSAAEEVDEETEETEEKSCGVKRKSESSRDDLEVKKKKSDEDKEERVEEKKKDQGPKCELDSSRSEESEQTSNTKVEEKENIIIQEQNVRAGEQYEQVSITEKEEPVKEEKRESLVSKTNSQEKLSDKDNTPSEKGKRSQKEKKKKSKSKDSKKCSIM